MTKILFILNDPPHRTERSYNAPWAEKVLVF